MKNSNIKIKLVARVMLLVLLFASAVNLVGCETGNEKYIIMKTHDTNWYSPIELVVTSENTIFSKEDVKLNISYSMYPTDKNGEPVINEEHYYHDALEHYKNRIVYGLYIAKISDYEEAHWDKQWYTNDVKNIENYYYVKQISEEEALSKEYSMISSRFAIGYGFDQYNHTEQITIPAQFVEEKQGCFLIIITMFGMINENEYIALDSSRIECFYNSIDEDIVKIDMKQWIYFRIL